MIYVLPIPIMLLWLIGGQVAKGARRFGVPGITMIVGLWTALGDKSKKPREKWGVLALVLLIPVLCLGYGVDSVFTKIFKKEWIVRLIYAIVLSIPVGVYAVIAQETWKMLFVVPALVGAFQIRAGKLFSIGKFDVLIEDIARSLTLGVSLVWLLR